VADFNVLEIQKQVRLMVGHDGLDNKVILWTNRVLQEIGIKAYWQSQIVRQLVAPTVNVATTVTSNWISTNLSTVDVINIYRAEQAQMNGTAVSKYVGPVNRQRLDSYFANYLGRDMSLSSASIDQYAVVNWTPYASTATLNYMAPQVAFYPGPTAADTSTVGAVLISYLQAPAKLTTATGATATNWMIEKYFDTVLSGVMRYARLYVGDAQGYLLEKGDYENGVRDMLLNEEVVSAQVPVFRGVTPETMNRF
jgi:hypothetical protein